MRRALPTLLLSLALATGAGGAISGHERPALARPRLTQGETMQCDRPAPTTPEGYRALWDTIPKIEWGAADVSLSVRVGDRRVWLYGDTMSEAEDGVGFVHSTGIVQTKGCVRVSRAGAQLIPDESRTLIHWIDKAWKVKDATDLLRVKSRGVRLTGTGAWAFEDAGFWRTSTVRLEPEGDLTWLRWGDRVASPPPDPGPMIDLDEPGGPGHFAYSIRRHGLLPDGRRLMTVCQNWDDGVWHGWDNYRPIFYAEGEEPWLA